MDNRLCL
ncbi:hypothetical protein MTR67_038494 [Solanum verrucosum]|nr:hypothetical protein MTR67_038494 [Solanum verrucosum]